jgi:DNA-binding response OmpR family regulator
VTCPKPFCPHCGYDLVHDQPIILNDFSMLSSHSPLLYRGQPIKLSAAMRSLCWTLMKSYPRPVREDVILDRMGSEAEGNVIDVYMSRIRKALREIKAPIPFENVTSKLEMRAIVWKLA